MKRKSYYRRWGVRRNHYAHLLDRVAWPSFEEQVQEMAAWCYQFVGAHNGPVEALNNLSAMAFGTHTEPPPPIHEWPYPIVPPEAAR